MITVIGTLKGGSGKSTLTFNLGIRLALAKIDVQLVDADPQATLTDALAVRRAEAFDPLPVAHDRAALTPATLRAHAETLIDVGTADMAALRQALSLCDRVVVPVPPSQADIWSTQRFVTWIARTVERAALPELIAFINRGDTNQGGRETAEAAAALMSLPGVRFIKPRLSQRTVFRRSFSEGLAVFELEPRGKAAHEFHALTAALFPYLLA